MKANIPLSEPSKLLCGALRVPIEGEGDLHVPYAKRTSER